MASVHIIRPTTSPQDVSAATTADDIVAITGGDYVITAASANDVVAHRVNDCVGTSATKDLIVTWAAVHVVGS